MLQPAAESRTLTVWLEGQPLKTVLLKGLVETPMAWADYLPWIRTQAVSDWQRTLAKARRVHALSLPATKSTVAPADDPPPSAPVMGPAYFSEPTALQPPSHPFDPPQITIRPERLAPDPFAQASPDITTATISPISLGAEVTDPYKLNDQRNQPGETFFFAPVVGSVGLTFAHLSPQHKMVPLVRQRYRSLIFSLYLLYALGVVHQYIV